MKNLELQKARFVQVPLYMAYIYDNNCLLDIRVVSYFFIMQFYRLFRSFLIIDYYHLFFWCDFLILF